MLDSTTQQGWFIEQLDIVERAPNNTARGQLGITALDGILLEWLATPPRSRYLGFFFELAELAEVVDVSALGRLR